MCTVQESSDCWSPQGWLQASKPSQAGFLSQQRSPTQTRQHPGLATAGTRQTGRKLSVSTQPATADNKPSEQLQQAVPQSATGDRGIKQSTSSERHTNGHLHAVASMQSIQPVDRPASGADTHQMASAACQDAPDPCQQPAAAAPEAADPAVMLAAQLIQQPVLLQGVLVQLEHFAAQGTGPTVLIGPASPAGCSDVHVSMPAISLPTAVELQAVELLAPSDTSPAAAEELQRMIGTSEGPAEMLHQQLCLSSAPHQPVDAAGLVLPGDDQRADTAADDGIAAAEPAATGRDAAMCSQFLVLCCAGR